MNLFDTHVFPWWLWIVAVLWTAHQASAGFAYGLYIHRVAGEQASKGWFAKYAVYGAHHAAIYLTATVIGFVALNALLTVGRRIGDWATLSAGASALLLGMALLSAFGISGGLAGMMYRGQSLKG